MDEMFTVIYQKDSRNHMVQCKACGAKSPLLRVGKALDTWKENHKCGEEAEEKTAEETTPTPAENGTQDPPPADPEPTGDADPSGDEDSAGDAETGDGDGEPDDEEEEEEDED